ncbi:MAG: pyruvate kinase [archaeon]
MKNAKAIVTIPPYAPFVKEVVNHPIVSGLRLNTVMPVNESLEDVLGRLYKETESAGKDLWIDLKCRQLRVKNFGVPPFTEIELTHNLEVNTPVTAYFSDGEESATVLRVDGNKLIMQEGPRRVVGPGESVNIPDRSLKIDGYLTEVDKNYINAAKSIGLHNYMISYVEGKEDAGKILKLDFKANIIEKIESLKGLNYVMKHWVGKTGLMTARGDLYVEMKLPHQVIEAEEMIIGKDENAVVASRIFSSLSQSLEPTCADIGDVDNLLRMGYRTFMFGDDICMQRDSIMSGLNLFKAMAKKYEVGK